MKRIITRAAPVLVVAAVVATIVAGAPATAKNTLRLRAVDGRALRFNPSHLRSSAGKVTIVMRNPKANSLSHAVEVEGKGLEKEGRTVGPGGTSRVTVKLEKGRTYTYYCPVKGHRKAGMVGRITVG